MRISSTSRLRKYGIVIPELSKVGDKMKLGMRFGLANLVTIIFGLYALKNASLPM